MLSYVVYLSHSSIISVKAKSFADREIRYTLKAQGQGAGTFNIGPTSGIVKLAKELDFEDLRQPHVYSLVVTATEDSGGFSTSVEVCTVWSNNFIIYIFLPSASHAFGTVTEDSGGFSTSVEVCMVEIDLSVCRPRSRFQNVC